LRFLHNTGFSIIECLVALALMAIVAAIALPGWGKLLPSFRLDSATRQVQSELHSVKMRAAAENLSFQIAYTQGASAYAVQSDSSVAAIKPLPDGIIVTKTGTISFSPRGTASGNRVRLQNTAGDCRQVVVSPTGRVRICKPSGCSSDC
jgi:prepilin-type N-terminal cleavage/methylation domain-containing protein